MRRPEPWRGTLALSVAALALIVACGGEDDGPTEPPVVEPPEPPVATTINIAPPAAELSSFGETVELTATVLDQNGQAMAGASVSWTSNDTAVATVTTAGVVTAVQNGSATVTATSGAASGTASVTVAQQPAQIDVSPAADTLFSVGDTVRLAAEARDANGNAVPGLDFAWASADGAIATVDSAGLVTATADGSVNITAEAGGASGAAAITVSQLPVEMDVMPAATTLFSLGDTVRLVAAAFDANGNAVASISFTWTSENDAVVSVDQNGLATAVRTGSTDVFAEAGELRDSAGVSVTQLASEVRVTPAVDTLDAVGDTVRLTAVALDRNGYEVEDTDYIWTARHPLVVTVDSTGLVTAVGSGTGEIRVQATRAGANHIAIAVITVRQTAGRQ